MDVTTSFNHKTRPGMGKEQMKNETNVQCHSPTIVTRADVDYEQFENTNIMPRKVTRSYGFPI